MMKWIRICSTLAATFALSTVAQAGLLNGMFGGSGCGSSKSCSCAPEEQPSCCKPVIVRPCNPTVHTYQRACSTIKPPCCETCAAPSSCNPCAPACETPCAPACATPCAPACETPCAPTCETPCAPVSCAPCTTCEPKKEHKCLFSGFSGKGCSLFSGKSCCSHNDSCAPTCATPCAPACETPCAPECCAPSTCEPKQGHKCLFSGMSGKGCSLFSGKSCCSKDDSCAPTCAAPCAPTCEPACDAPCAPSTCEPKQGHKCLFSGMSGKGCSLFSGKSCCSHDDSCAPTCAAPCAPECASTCEPKSHKGCGLFGSMKGKGCGLFSKKNSCTSECCAVDPCEIAQLIYTSQTACYAKDRAEALDELAEYSCICNPEIMCAFIYGLNDADERVRAEAADSIGDQIEDNGCCCCTPEVIAALTAALGDCDEDVVGQAEEALELCGYEIVDGCCEQQCTNCAPGYAPAMNYNPATPTVVPENGTAPTTLPDAPPETPEMGRQVYPTQVQQVSHTQKKGVLSRLFKN